MAEVLLETDTYDVHIDPPQIPDVEIGNPMDKGSVITITKNGKHVVSGYDLAEVEVQPVVSGIKVTENGTYLPSDYDVDAFNKVEVQVDDTRRVMTEFVNNGGKFSKYTGTQMPNVDWDRVTITNADYMFDSMRIEHIYAKFLTCKIFNNPLVDTNMGITKTIDLEIPIATRIYGLFSYRGSSSVESVIVRRLGENDEDIVGSIHLDFFPNLTNSSLIDFFVNLGTRTGKHTQPPITLGETNYNKLTEDEIKIATDKGWTVIQ